MAKFQSTKLFDGFSCVFRQWKAEDTHCKFLLGYWIWDFGGMKRAQGKIDGLNPKAWMDYMFDHTTIIAKDDPYLFTFQGLHDCGVIQLRIIPAVGAEQFAKYIFNKVNEFVLAETKNRVRVAKVEVYENERNSATYEDSVETLVIPKVQPPVWVSSNT